VGTESSPLSFDEATDEVLAGLVPLPPETIDLTEARDRVLAESVAAPENVPANASSAMDGYGLPRALVDTLRVEGHVSARVVGEVAAGVPGFEVAPGDDAVIRIFTGGVVPAWVAAILPQEQTRRDGDRVVMEGPLSDGANIRGAGGDIRIGDTALQAGAPLHPPAIAVLASLGIDRVVVGARPRVGILVTGTEVVAGGPLRPGQIRDSNGPTLAAAVRACGAGIVHLDRVPDDTATLRTALESMLSRVDILLTSGGVSVGDHDLVKETLEDLGVRRLFWGVAQRPGRPFYAGRRDGVLVLGLPGNPASALATFLAHGWPAMRRMQGTRPERVRSRAVLSAPVRKTPNVTAMIRGRRRLDGVTITAEPSGPQESHQMAPFARANCLVLVPPDCSRMEAGSEVDVIPFPWSDPV
jgi:molybdopterin molybdotransferase